MHAHENKNHLSQIIVAAAFLYHLLWPQHAASSLFSCPLFFLGGFAENGVAKSPWKGSPFTIKGILALLIGGILFVLPFFINTPGLKIVLFSVFALFIFFVYLPAKDSAPAQVIEKKKEEIKEETTDIAAPPPPVAAPVSCIIPDQNEALDKLKEEQKELLYSQKLLAISRFSSVVSHELKNPLASLKNISYFLSKAVKIEDERAKRMLEILSNEIDRTDAIINNLSNISHIKRENKAVVNIKDLVEAALLETPLNEHIQLTKNIDSFDAKIDPEKFKLVVKNLITNARDAIIDSGKIDITIKKAEDHIELVVTDTGCGMDNETLEQIFEPMFSTKTKVLGMGLTMLKEIVTMYRGTIDISTEIGKGSTFKVTLSV